MAKDRVQTDGRVARGVRTRRRIVDAHSALLRSGNLKPTAQEIAARAGVSVRTLWANFHDLEGLLAETTQYWLDADEDLRTEIDPDAPLDARILAYCSERARRMEHLGPAARSASLSEPFSEALRTSRSVHVGRLRSEIDLAFAQELDAAGNTEETLAHAMAALTGWPAWNLLRSDFGLSVEEATEVMHRGMTAMLGTHDGPAPRGTDPS